MKKGKKSTPAPAPERTAAAGPLHGLRVVDVTETGAGRTLAWLLADQGAEVVRAGAPSGRFTDRGTTWLGPIDPAALAALAARADLWLDDAPTPGLRADLLVHPRLICVHLPCFAEDHPLHHARVSDGAVEAVAGLHDRPLAREPAYSPLALLRTATAAWGAVGAMAALIARERDGRGRDVRVAQSDVAFDLLELTALLTVSPPRAWASLQWASTPFIGGYPASDGAWFYLHAGLERHLARLVALLEAQVPEPAAALRAALSAHTLADPTSVPTLREGLALRAALTRCIAARPAAVWERLFLEAGLCGVVVQRAAGWRAHPHARASGQVIEVAGRAAPGVQVRLSATRGAARAAETAALATMLDRWAPQPAPTGPMQETPALAGVKVLDFTQVIAGPVAGRVLAALGADVLRVENPHFRAPWVEAFHIAFNAGKRSVVRDLSAGDAPSEVQRLLAAHPADIVVQNLRAGAAEALGMDEAAIRRARPEAVYAHLTAWGDAGPWAAAPGWEQTAQAACGVQEAWGGEGPPELYPLPCNDVVTGLMGAFGSLLGLYHQRRGGGGQRVATSLSATATLLQAPALFDDAPQVRGRNAVGPSPLHRFYRAADGWLLLDAERAGVGLLASVPGLWGARDLAGTPLMACLESAFRTESVARWVERFVGSGLGDQATVLPWTTARQALSAEAARGRVRRVPAGALGEVTLTEPPLRLARLAPPTLGPAPERPDLNAPRPALPRWVGAQVRGALGLALGPWAISRASKPGSR